MPDICCGKVLYDYGRQYENLLYPGGRAVPLLPDFWYSIGKCRMKALDAARAVRNVTARVSDGGIGVGFWI